VFYLFKQLKQTPPW